MDAVIAEFVRDRPRLERLATILTDAHVHPSVIMAALREAASWGMPAAVPGLRAPAPDDNVSA